MNRIVFPSTVLFLFCVCAVAEQKPNAVSGSTFYVQQDCAHCHGRDLKGTKKGPDVSAIDRKTEWTTEKMATQILDGGQKMPPFHDSLTDDQVADLIAFLRAHKRPELPPPPATPARAKDPDDPTP